jgi:hypothetical protein
VDVAEFNAAVKRAATAPAGSEKRVDALRAAIGLYRGDLLEPPSPEMQQLLAGMQGHPAAMDAFVSVTAGTLSPGEFFASVSNPV